MAKRGQARSKLTIDVPTLLKRRIKAFAGAVKHLVRFWLAPQKRSWAILSFGMPASTSPKRPPQNRR